MAAQKTAATSAATRNKDTSYLRYGDIETFVIAVLHVVLETYQRLFERGLLPDGVGVDIVLVHVRGHVYNAHERPELIVDARKSTLDEAAL